MTPEPFRIEVSDQRLDDMRRRLNATSWPGDFGNASWRYGVEQEWLAEIVAYWANEYDWRVHEERMNTFPQFRVHIDGVPVHFMHIKSGHPDAIPLILTHGWPWTFWDWHDLVVNLIAGNNSQLPFDIVVPSLPGF